MQRDDGISKNDLLFVLLFVFPFFAGIGLLAAKGNRLFLQVAFFILLLHIVASLWLALSSRRPKSIELPGIEFGPFAVGAAWWFLLFGITDGHFVNLVPIVLCGLVANLVFAVILSRLIPSDRRAFGAVVLLPAAPLFAVLVASINIYFDYSAPLQHRSPVILKFQGDDRRVVTLPVDKSQPLLFVAELPKKADYRQLIEYNVHPGLLKMKWISGLRVTEDFATLSPSDLSMLAAEASTQFRRSPNQALQGGMVSFGLISILAAQMCLYAYLSGSCPNCKKRNFTLGATCGHCGTSYGGPAV